MSLRVAKALGIALALGLTFFFCGGACGAAEPPAGQEPIRAMAFIGPENGQLPAGQVSEAILAVAIAPGFHLNSDQPTFDWLKPTRLVFEPRPPIEVTEITFPQAKLIKFAWAEAEVPVFEEMLLISLKLKVQAGAAAGPVDLPGRLIYQACTEAACLPEAELAFSLKLAVAEAASVKEKARPAVSPAGGKRAWLLLTLFLVGLALNLSPCVYPLFPITVGYFAGQSQTKAGLLGRLIAYLLSLMAAYTALGSLAALSGQMLGAALQHPATIIVLAAIIAGLGLSLLGVWEFRLPGFISRLGSAGAGQKGYAAAILMGLTLGIAAAPCLGPTTAAAMTMVAQSADPFFGAAVFASLSLGLGLPMVVIGLFSSILVQRLPASGAWLVWVRKILAALTFIAAIYLLRPLLGEFAWGLLMALAFLGGAALIFLSGRTVKPLLRFLVPLGFLAGAVFFLWPPASQQAMEWPPYSAQALEEAKEAGRPVVLDFYADWCAPCRIMAQSLADPKVVELTRRLVALKVDLTEWQAGEVEALRRRYAIRGVPTLVFLGPDGQEMADLRLVGAVGPEEIAARMEEALRRSGEGGRD